MQALLMLGTGLFGSWWAERPPEPTSSFVAWLDHWQNLIAGGLSALAVVLVTLFVWRYEVWHARRQATQDEKRLARSLSLEIQTIISRLYQAHATFHRGLIEGKTFLMPEIARPFPVYSNHTRDLALFDDETAKHTMLFYEDLSAYADARSHFRTTPGNQSELKSTARTAPPEQSFSLFLNWEIPRGEQLRERLDMIAAGRTPGPWQPGRKPHSPLP